MAEQQPPKDESFFRKVVRFVANPATDWADLNSRQDDGGELDLEKSELKAMIERKLLKKISQSLTRIEAGDYGYCDETGEPIGLGRLLARPTATLSLEAQQRRELKQKMFGD